MADAERAEELLIEQFTGSDGREAVARRNAEILQALRDLQLPQASCFDHSSASRNGQLATAHESVQPVQIYRVVRLTVQAGSHPPPPKMADLAGGSTS